LIGKGRLFEPSGWYLWGSDRVESVFSKAGASW
jgi:hypothetical protein